MRPWAAALVAALFLVWAAPAAGQGGPPLATDDPGTPGPGAWELNLAWTHERTEGQQRFEAPVLDLNYGCGERIQLKAEIPWVWLDGPEGWRDGMGNPALGLKWRFLDEERHAASVSVYPQVTLGGRSSAVDRGLAEKGAELLLPVQVQKALPWGSANLELGHAFGEGGDDQWIYGLALGREVGRGIEVLAEVYGASPSEEEAGLAASVGGRWSLAENLRLLVAAGRGLDGAEAADFLAYLGLQFLF